MVFKNKEEGPNFDLEGFRRDLISKVSGTREGIIILTTLMTEMYLRSQGPQGLAQLEEVVSQHIEAINQAERAAENQHFVNDEE